MHPDMTLSGPAVGLPIRVTLQSLPALDEERILVTLDKDFGELAIVRGEPHCGIVWLVDCSVTRQAATCLSPSDITVCLPSRMSLKPTFSRTRIAC